jgi:hypothetical protein
MHRKGSIEGTAMQETPRVNLLDEILTVFPS